MDRPLTSGRSLSRVLIRQDPAKRPRSPPTRGGLPRPSGAFGRNTAEETGRVGHHGHMNASQVAMLRELLATTGWTERTREFARALRASAKDPGGLLLFGPPDDEPWHLAAHLDDEARLNAAPELRPTLVRWDPPPGAPPHLRVGLERLEAAGRGEALLVVSEEDETPAAVLERVDDARRVGATILTLDTGDRELEGLAHEALTVPAHDALVTFEAAQHLVSAAAGEPRPRGGLRARLARLLDVISGPASMD